MEEVIKKKRGRPRKNPIPEVPEKIQALAQELPTEIKSLIDEVQEKQQQLQEEIHELRKPEIQHKEGEWDVKIGDPIEFFDKRLSYEITGYKPITETEGLDFDPDWFTEARHSKETTGHYTSYYFGSKAYRDFWNREYKRCREGLTVNGYTVTGPHYYFLNYYQLPETSVKKAGTSRRDIFPNFYTAQYEFFHYYELCKHLKKDVCMFKSRGVGFSEINAAICNQIYNCYPNSVCMLTANAQNYIDKSLDKVWGGMTYANDNTDGGFFKLRQVIDKQMAKKASYYKMVNGQKVEDGWMSLVEAIVADNDRKIRGDRVDLLIYEEAGSNPVLRQSYIKGNALVEIGGNRFGIRFVGGTGGDRDGLEGLSDMFYNPEAYNVLPFLNDYNEEHEWVKTAFFIPANIAFYREGYVDHRGVCDIKRTTEFYEQERAKLENSPKALVDYKAEYCFYPSEAFALEGDNIFNKVKLVEQISTIKFKKDYVPKIETGYMEFIYSNPNHKRETISGVRFKPHPNGPIHIIQHPLWEVRGNDREPGETEEEYVERKSFEEEISFSKMNNLYVTGIDGIDLGQQDTSDATKNPSKFCAMIKRRVHGMKAPMYVAYYLDRPQRIEEAYEQTLALMYYYNAVANLEASKVGILTWAKKEKWMHYFMRRPRVCQGDPSKKRSPTAPYGTTTSTAMIEHGLQLVASYIEDYYNEIWFIELLNQFLKYSDENKGKFDMVAACQMAEIADEELSEVLPTQQQPKKAEFRDVGYYYDEKGIRHFGIIPKPQETAVRGHINTGYVEGYNITSNPRYR